MGRKRTINQSTCNKDYSCVKGLLPVLRHHRRRQAAASAPPASDVGDIGDLPEPASRPSLERPYNVAVGGVGGTGVLTIGALLGMAAHVEGEASMILDMSGLAQKGGAVLSHVRLSQHTDDVTCSRIVTTGTAIVDRRRRGRRGIARTRSRCASPARTVGIINSHVIPTADFILNRDFNFQTPQGQRVCWRRRCARIPRSSTSPRPAEALLGDSIATNIMMMGYAYQRGLLPLLGQGDRAGDRGQRRLDQDEHAGLPARPAGRRRPSSLQAT